MKRIAYIGMLPYDAKVSTEHDQNGQLSIVQSKVNDYEIVVEKAGNSISPKRTLYPLIKSLNEGDELIVCSLKYLAPNSDLLLKIATSIEEKGTILTVLDIDNSIPSALRRFREFNTFERSMRKKESIRKNESKTRRNEKVKALLQTGIGTKQEVEVSLIKQPAGRPKVFNSQRRVKLQMEKKRGKTNKQLAEQFGVSLSTIKTELKKKI